MVPVQELVKSSDSVKVPWFVELDRLIERLRSPKAMLRGPIHAWTMAHIEKCVIEALKAQEICKTSEASGSLEPYRNRLCTGFEVALGKLQDLGLIRAWYRRLNSKRFRKNQARNSDLPVDSINYEIYGTGELSSWMFRYQIDTK